MSSMAKNAKVKSSFRAANRVLHRAANQVPARVFTKGSLVILLLLALLVNLISIPSALVQAEGAKLGSFHSPMDGYPSVELRYTVTKEDVYEFMHSAGSEELKAVLADLKAAAQGGSKDQAAAGDGADDEALKALSARFLFDASNGGEAGPISSIVNFFMNGTSEVYNQASTFDTYKSFLTVGSSINDIPTAGERLKLPEEAAEGIFSHLGDMGDALTFTGLLVNIWTLSTEEDSTKLDKANFDLVTTVFNLAAGQLGYLVAVGEAVDLAYSGLTYAASALADLAVEAQNSRRSTMKNVYTIYNESYHRGQKEGAWTLKNWRDAFVEIIDANAATPDQIPEKLQEEIDKYCNRFWKLPVETQIEIESSLNLTNPLFGPSKFTLDNYDSGPNKKMRDNITEEYKAQLTAKLSDPNFARSVQYVYCQRIADSLQKKLDEQTDYLNEHLEFAVVGPLVKKLGPDGESTVVYPYEGYTVRFGDPEESEFIKKNLQAFERVMSVGTERLAPTITRLGYLEAGMPTEVYFWKPDQDPDKDEPDFSAEFQWNGDKPRPLKLEPPEEIGIQEGTYRFSEEETDFNPATGLADWAPILMTMDLFGAEMNNIGAPQKLNFTLQQASEDASAVHYNLTYSFFMGGEGYATYQGEYKGEVNLNKEDQTLTGQADIKSSIDPNREYHLEFKLNYDESTKVLTTGTMRVSRVVGGNPIYMSTYALSFNFVE